jgi:hypothetical protein
VKYFPLIFLLIVLLSACASATPGPVTSGVEGQVFIGPTCPVMQLDTPCPDKPYQAILTIYDNNHRKISQFQTEIDGTFHVGLAPGDYILHPESASVMPSASDQPFKVSPGEYTNLVITYDSGIR